MSKKTLLNEAAVRRFMKLADMGTLSDNFINEMGSYYNEDEPEDDDMKEGHGMTAYQDDEDEKMDDDMMAMDDEKEEMPGDEGPEDEPMPEEEPEMDDMDDMGDDADEVEISEDDRAALAAAIPVLEKIAGGAGGDMDMGDMGVEDDPGMMDEPMEEGHGMKADDDKKPMEEMGHAGKRDDELDEVELVDENDLVQEVTRRVAARLRAAMKSRK